MLISPQKACLCTGNLAGVPAKSAAPSYKPPSKLIAPCAQVILLFYICISAPFIVSIGSCIPKTWSSGERL
jgi:hypothetical protein